MNTGVNYANTGRKAQALVLGLIAGLITLFALTVGFSANADRFTCSPNRTLGTIYETITPTSGICYLP
jgi:hypothetical protein